MGAINGLKRNHQTALFFIGAALGSNTEYRDRAKRTQQSVNGANIKADVYTAFPDGAGVGIVSGLVTDVPPSSDVSVDALVALARDAGYNHVLVSLPTS